MLRHACPKQGILLLLKRKLMAGVSLLVTAKPENPCGHLFKPESLEYTWASSGRTSSGQLYLLTQPAQFPDPEGVLCKENWPVGFRTVPKTLAQISFAPILVTPSFTEIQPAPETSEAAGLHRGCLQSYVAFTICHLVNKGAEGCVLFPRGLMAKCAVRRLAAV